MKKPLLIVLGIAAIVIAAIMVVSAIQDSDRLEGGQPPPEAAPPLPVAASSPPTQSEPEAVEQEEQPPVTSDATTNAAKGDEAEDWGQSEREIAPHPPAVRFHRPAVLTGRVVDELGRPRFDAQVHVWPMGPGGREGVYIVDSEGRFACKSLSGGVSYVVLLAVHRPSLWIIDRRLVQIPPGAKRHIEFRLPVSVDLEGTVRDQYGKPVADAVVRTSYVDHINCKSSRPHVGLHGFVMRHCRKTRTDRFGRFRFADVPGGDWYLGVSMDKSLPAHLAFRGAWFPVVTKGTSKKIVRHLVVHRGLRIEGQVVDPSGLGLAGSVVAIVSPEHREIYDKLTWIKADPSGRFKIGPLHPGEYELVAWARSPQTPYLTFSNKVTTTAGSTGVVLKLRVGGIIEGRILPSSGKEHQWDVFVSSKEYPFARDVAKTDKAARFRTRPLPDGTYKLFMGNDDAGAPRYGLVSGIKVEAGKTLRLPDIDCTRPDIDCSPSRSPPVRVAIPGVDDFPARKVTVEVVRADGIEIGTYRVWGVPCTYSLPQGTYRFTLRVDGEVKDERQVVVAPGQAAPVILDAGQ